jgi:hypothetical protein
MKLNTYQMVIIGAEEEYYFAASDENLLKFTIQCV